MAFGDPDAPGNGPGPGGPGRSGGGEPSGPRGGDRTGTVDAPGTGTVGQNGRTGGGDPSNFGYGPGANPGRGRNPGRGFFGDPETPQPGGRGQDFGWDKSGGSTPESRREEAIRQRQMRGWLGRFIGAALGFAIGGPGAIGMAGRIGGAIMGDEDFSEAEEDAIESGVGFEGAFPDFGPGPRGGGPGPGESDSAIHGQGPPKPPEPTGPTEPTGPAEPPPAPGSPEDVDQYFEDQFGFTTPMPVGPDWTPSGLVGRDPPSAAMRRQQMAQPALAYMARVNADIRRARQGAQT